MCNASWYATFSLCKISPNFVHTSPGVGFLFGFVINLLSHQAVMAHMISNMRDCETLVPSFASKLINSISLLRRSNGDIFIFSIRRDILTHSDLVNYVKSIYDELNKDEDFSWLNFHAGEIAKRQRIKDTINSVLLALINSSSLTDFCNILIDTLNLLLK